MTRDEAREFARIVQAYADGSVIQCFRSDGQWYEVKDPRFDEAVDCYRIKPEPREANQESGDGSRSR